MSIADDLVEYNDLGYFPRSSRPRARQGKGNKVTNKISIPLCPSCGKAHDIMEVKFENVEEGPYGDVLTYVCPITNRVAQSEVYESR